MNNKNIKKNIKEFKSVKMSDFDNDKIVNSFSTFLDYDQVNKLKKLKKEESEPVKTYTLSFIYSATRYIRPANLVAVCLVFVLAGAGTVFAASDSKPKDILYTVKVNINEKFETILADDLGDVNIAIEQINNRYKDVKTVAVSSYVDVKTKNVVKDNLNKHIEFAEKKIKKVKQKNIEQATILQIELEATIAANVEAIQDVVSLLNKQDDKGLKEIVDEGQKSFEKVSENNPDLKLDEIEIESESDFNIESDDNSEQENTTRTMMVENENETENNNESLEIKIKPQTEYEILFKAKKDAIKNKLKIENIEILKTEKESNDNLENDKNNELSDIQNSVIDNDQSVEEFREEIEIDIDSKLNPKNIDLNLNEKINLDTNTNLDLNI